MLFNAGVSVCVCLSVSLFVCICVHYNFVNFRPIVTIFDMEVAVMISALSRNITGIGLMSWRTCHI